MAPSIQTVSAITLQAITPRIADNVTLGNATLAFLRNASRMTLEEGADFIQEPMQWALNGTAQSYTGYTPFNLTPQEEITAAVYGWKQYSAVPSISGTEQIRNANSNGVLKAWAQKTRIAESSLVQLLDAHIHADFTTKAVTDLLGLDEFVENTNPPSATIGGINRAVEIWWRNKYREGTQATITQDLRATRIDASEGSESPDFGVTNPEAWQALVNQNAGKQRLINQAMMALNYDNFVLDGVTIMWNRNCQGNGVSTPSAATPWNIYLLNSKYLRLRIHRDRNFSAREVQTPIGQDALIGAILFAGALTLSDSRFQAVLKIIG